MRRVLDQLAEAFAAVQGNPMPRHITGSVKLRNQFGLPVTPSRWKALADQLHRALPPLENRDDSWSFPMEWKTIWDLAAYLTAQPFGGLLPHKRTAAAWCEAQVFVGVRAVLVEVSNLKPDEVVRPARLQADLGLE